MSDIKQQLSDAASKEIAGVKSRVYGQVGKVEAEVKGKFQTFLSNHPKKLIAIALVLGLFVGLFLGAVAGVQIADAKVNVVSGDTSETGGEQQATTQQGWFEYKPWGGNLPSYGNG